MPSRPEIAQDAKETPYTARQEAISKAHDENIEASKQLVAALQEIDDTMARIATVLERVYPPG